MRISLRVRRVYHLYACIIIIVAANLLAAVKLRVSPRYAAVSALKSAVTRCTASHDKRMHARLKNCSLGRKKSSAIIRSQFNVEILEM